MSNALFENVYNPDVLSCLANLSNDEVFTPPDVVNRMLDMLPQELFRNPDTTFLDPACKTGVFLREIAKRLIIGLEAQIPDLQETIKYIKMKLDENERGNQTRLMKVKDMMLKEQMEKERLLDNA